jgi:DNA-binding XRE family transcriptional regulator
MAGVTQARMAEEMGLPLRTYEDIEAGRTKYRPIHRIAGEMALIKIAVEKRDVAIIPMGSWETVGKAGKLVSDQLGREGRDDLLGL